MLMASRSSASHGSVCSPTRATAHARASERERATPASTSVSRTRRSGWRSRVMTGTESVVKSSSTPSSSPLPGIRAPQATLRP